MMSSKLNLDGNETLEEIREMIKELKIVERRLLNCLTSLAVEGDGRCTENDCDSDPTELLTENDLGFLEDYSFSGISDASALAIPGSTIDSYPRDFGKVAKLDSELLAVKNNLMNFVRSVINEQSLCETFKEEDQTPIKPVHSPDDGFAERTHTQPTIKRKNSYTIERHDKPIADTSSYDGLFCPSPNAMRLHTTQPITSTPAREKRENYCTNTYSKKSSPFSSTRPHAELPFDTTTRLDNLHVTPKLQQQRVLPNMNMAPVDGDLDNRGIGRHETRLEAPQKLHNLSMEELQCLARLQQESLLSAGVPEKHVIKNEDWHHPMNKSIEEDDGSGSTGNDTYSVSVSKTPSETSSGISSPPAGSLEDIQLDPLRRSMPNLATKTHLSLAPTYTSSLQREAYYNSDLKLFQSRNKSKANHAPNRTMTIQGPLLGDTEPPKTYRPTPESNHMEPLKRALARADTYLQSEADADDGGSMNRYATYQVSKGATKLPQLGRGSRIPGPTHSFGFGTGTVQTNVGPAGDAGDPRLKSALRIKRNPAQVYIRSHQVPSSVTTFPKVLWEMNFESYEQ